jgi:hypothetical protein
MAAGSPEQRARFEAEKQRRDAREGALGKADGLDSWQRDWERAPYRPSDARMRRWQAAD